MVSGALCGLCGHLRHVAAIQKLLVCPNQRGDLQLPGCIGASITSTYHADRPGSCAQRQCHQGVHGKLAAEAWGGYLQVSKVLQHQARKSPPLQHLQEMHPQDGPPLPLGEQLCGRKQPEMYIALISIYALCLSGLQFFTCVKVQWNECSDFSPPVAVMLMIFLCLEGLLFLTFTAVMFGTQIHSICNDETEIERLKNEKPTWERRMRWDGMRAVFGGQPSLLWINPFAGLRPRGLLTLRSRRGGAEFSV
ncbi:palmitoyltransferase ZDHHC7 isoform X3 [Scleropages formosus]|uniref:palmitoyltransferase ZDHHC7 isoform X3 n=1 Tax=Scleropages formosus TaxID=113540 RepID=UPI0008790492|nr:palmitoyltransferase ZDHHC7-like isoform X3 [Scleropages formosus]